MRAALAEAIGTYMLVLAGCGAIMVDAMTGSLGHFGIAATFGLVVGAMVYATGHVSMAQLNPAVTLAFAASGHFPWRRVPVFIAAQLAGATTAAFTLRAALGDIADIGATTPSTMVTLPAFLGVEIVATAMLMFVITSVATDRRAAGGLAGVAIGATVALNALWAGPLTGASMNPARSIGPAIAAADVTWMLHYIAAPVIGALLGAFAYQAIRAGTPTGVVP